VPNNRRRVTVEYKVLVPRDSRLVVRHDTGYIWVSDVTGDIDVNSRTGDMIVMLPDTISYSVDARTRLGSVSSDAMGKGQYRFVAGNHFAYASQTPSRRVSLRMGCGSITIKRVRPPDLTGRTESIAGCCRLGPEPLRGTELTRVPA